VSTPIEPVRVPVVVQGDPAAAFELFGEGFGGWWPREYTWGRDALEWIGLEPRTGGRCYERGPHEFHSDWGRVLAWEPPRRVVIAWQISPRREPEPDPARASEVEVRFEANGAGGTRVTLVHRQFERHGEGAAGYRDAMASDQGWPWILRRYAAAAGEG
jgi:uncharacterized protein YndB with AHSA1/START domain